MSSKVRSKLEQHLSGFQTRQQERLAQRLRLKLIAAEPLPMDAPVRHRRRAAATFETPRTHHAHVEFQGL